MHRDRQETKLHTLLAWGLAGDTALLAPWLLGGRSSLAYPVLGTMAWGVAVLAVVSVLLQWLEYRPFAKYDAARGRSGQHPLRRFVWGAAYALPLWLFIAVLIGSLYNPAYLRHYAGDLVLQNFNAALPIVIDPARSGPGIYFLTGLLAALSLLGNPVMRPQRKWIRLILGALLVNAMILTWVGFWYRFTGADLLLGRFPPVADYFFATFYYKNHWAAYAILHCGIAGWFFFRDLPRWQEESRRAGAGGLALVALFFIGLSLPVVDSRWGMLLFAMFSIAFVILLYRHLPSRSGKNLLAGVSVVALAGFLYLSYLDLQANWQRTERQIASADSVIFDQLRATHAPEVCLNMFSVRPVWGWGYLSYEPLFPVFATDYFRDANGNLKSNMEFAHNDWLQHLAEFGAVGSLLLGLGLLPFLRALLRSKILGSGILLLALMAAFEFPFSNPAVLVTATVLLVLISGHDEKRRQLLD